MGCWDGISGNTHYVCSRVNNKSWEPTCEGQIVCDYVPSGSIYDVPCVRFLRNASGNFEKRSFYCVSGCGDTGESILEDWELIDGVWSRFNNVNVPSYAGWHNSGGTYNLPMTVPSRQYYSVFHGQTVYWYVDYYYLTVHVQDLLGSAMPGVYIYVDGESWGVTGGTGSITNLVPKGNHTVQCFIDATAWQCPGSNWDSWASTQCSYSVNVTGDQTQTVSMCMTNECRWYNFIISNGMSAGIGCSGIAGLEWYVSPRTTSARIRVDNVDQDASRAIFSVARPWDADGTYGITDETIYAHTWSPTWTNGNQTFKFQVGDIWYGSGEVPWAKILYVCWKNRPNYGRPGIDIDTSSIFVDCSAGSDNNSGMCNFSNALKTITKAQTLVANNGIIYVKYGNCLSETLASVLNPLVNNVRIKPVQSETVEGTGSVVINGT